MVTGAVMAILPEACPPGNWLLPKIKSAIRAFHPSLGDQVRRVLPNFKLPRFGDDFESWFFNGHGKGCK